MIRFYVGTMPARFLIGERLAGAIGAVLFVDEPASGSGWRNYRAAMRDGLELGAAWIVFVEDDAEPIPGFVGEVAHALEVAPGDFVSFFYQERARQEQARAHGCAWVQTIRVVNGVCWAIRAAVVPELLDWAARSVPAGYRMNDDILRGWLLASGRWNFTSSPSLVEHRQDLMSSIEPSVPNLGRCAGVLAAGPVEWNARAYLGVGPDIAERLRASERRKLAATGLTNLGA